MERKYEEIINYILGQKSDGHLKPGEKLPSIRALSKTFGCSINSIVKAYSEMEKEHKIYSVPKSGYFLVGTRNLEPNLTEELIDFSSAGPDRWNMPYRDYQHCMNQAIDLYKEEMFQYSEPLGLTSLRLQLSKQLQELQVFASPDRIAVVSGSQQALDILVSLAFPNEKEEICVEQPTHFSFIDSIRSRGLNAIGIEMTKDGINLTELEKIFKQRKIKFFYTVSRFQNPTGYSYTNQEKKKIVELAQKYHVYIIEDDYMGDLDTRRKADPMFAYDPSGRVIYTKSFSKVLLPGLRLGAVVLPDSLLGAFTQAKFAADVHTPVITQGALEIYLQSGMYNAHIQGLRKVYSEKGKILKQAFHKYLPRNVSYTGAESGFYSTIQLPSNIKAAHLVNSLKKKNVLIQDATGMYLPLYKKENVIRLSVSQVEDKKIEEGIQKLGEEIALLLGKEKEFIN
ncbi:aminotransferase-like domain-containing protein [Cytobacillus dafuensis]|uniref:PLP-dependent aminotransferase family protein n=1 Tax=Cytobacillus dafuensis TaxID=1742359 RepID=A0A5B8YZB8_CYTDA|nr:PLP-dependent aminotransferase family protein [Cytobacillus dafuensis]QED46084.1 PLP-dependent aminotransferase family protein [Cytobacillus dafuensis]